MAARATGGTTPKQPIRAATPVTNEAATIDVTTVATTTTDGKGDAPLTLDGAPDATMNPNADDLANLSSRPAPGKLTDLLLTGLEGDLPGKIPDKSDPVDVMVGDDFRKPIGTVGPRGGNSDVMSGGGRADGVAALTSLGYDRDAAGRMSDDELRTELQKAADRMHLEGTKHEGKEGDDLIASMRGDEDDQRNGTPVDGEPDGTGDDGGNTGDEGTQQTGTAEPGEQQAADPVDPAPANDPGPDSAEAAAADTAADIQKVGTDDETAGYGTGALAGQDPRDNDVNQSYDEWAAGSRAAQFQRQTGSAGRGTVTPIDADAIHRRGDPVDGGGAVAPLPLIDLDAPPAGGSTDGTTQPVDGGVDGEEDAGTPSSSFELIHGNRPPGSDDDNPTTASAMDDDGSTNAFDDDGAASAGIGGSDDDVPDTDGGAGGGGDYD